MSKYARTKLEEIVTPFEYYGLVAISKRMKWSPGKVKRMAIKYHFPILRLPTKSQRGWCYYTNESLLLAWYSGLIANTRRYLMADRKPRGTDTIREGQAPEGLPWQVSDIPAQSSSQQVSSLQSLPDTSETPASNANNINELARTSQGGGV